METREFLLNWFAHCLKKPSPWEVWIPIHEYPRENEIDAFEVYIEKYGAEKVMNLVVVMAIKSGRLTSEVIVRIIREKRVEEFMDAVEKIDTNSEYFLDNKSAFISQVNKYMN